MAGAMLRVVNTVIYGREDTRTYESEQIHASTNTVRGNPLKLRACNARLTLRHDLIDRGRAYVAPTERSHQIWAIYNHFASSVAKNINNT
jgi:hypothetical protein